MVDLDVAALLGIDGHALARGKVSEGKCLIMIQYRTYMCVGRTFLLQYALLAIDIHDLAYSKVSPVSICVSFRPLKNTWPLNCDLCLIFQRMEGQPLSRSERHGVGSDFPAVRAPVKSK